MFRHDDDFEKYQREDEERAAREKELAMLEAGGGGSGSMQGNSRWERLEDGSRVLLRGAEVSPAQRSRLARGNHGLRDVQGRLVDEQDLDEADVQAHSRALQFGILGALANLGQCIFNFILLFAYTGGINNFNGAVEGHPWATLLIIMFIAVLVVPGSTSHFIYFMFLLVDVYQCAYVDREAFFYTSTVLIYWTGTFFSASIMIGICLVVSASDVLHIVLRVMYLVLAILGLFMTWQVSKLQDTARTRLETLHVNPDGRQKHSKRQGAHAIADRLYSVA